MAQNSIQFANRLREVILNGTWIANTNYKNQLEKLTLEQAQQKTNASNSIALLAQHVHYYIQGVKNVFDGGDLLIKDQYSFDFPVFQSSQDWQAFLNQFWEDAEALAKQIEHCDNEKWEQAFVHEKYGNYQRNIDGLLEHSYYHLGQIVLLAKNFT